MNCLNLSELLVLKLPMFQLRNFERDAAVPLSEAQEPSSFAFLREITVLPLILHIPEEPIFQKPDDGLLTERTITPNRPRSLPATGPMRTIKVNRPYPPKLCASAFCESTGLL